MTELATTQPRPAARPEKDFLNRKEAANYLTRHGYPIAPQTLAKYACDNNAGNGPPYNRNGWGIQAIYARSDLDEWKRRKGVRVDWSGAQRTRAKAAEQLSSIANDAIVSNSIQEYTKVSHGKRLSRSEASVYLRETHGICHTTQTLANYAIRGIGPTFQRSRRATVYAEGDLDAYAASVLARVEMPHPGD